MNMNAFMHAMQNPQQYLMQQMVAAHPTEWQKCQDMFKDKSREQQVTALRELYKSKGMDLESIARQYGVQL